RRLDEIPFVECDDIPQPTQFSVPFFTSNPKRRRQKSKLFSESVAYQVERGWRQTAAALDHEPLVQREHFHQAHERRLRQSARGEFVVWNEEFIRTQPNWDLGSDGEQHHVRA